MQVMHSPTDRIPRMCKDNFPIYLSGTSAGDYPRVCGENLHVVILPPVFRGSPPRMWGKRDIRAAGDATARITPTYAGKTRRAKWHTTMRKDHPRVCGEKHLLHLSTFLLEGFEHRYSNVDILIWRLCGKGNELPKYGVFTRCFERAVVLAQKAIRCHSEKV